MTEKQKRFCDEYLIDANATQAAIRAGYAEKSAGRNADRMMKNEEIKAYIAEQMESISSEKVATAEEVIQYLTSVLRGETLAEEIVVEGVGDGMSEARRMDKAPSEKDRLKAAELLGKRYGLFRDNVSLTAEPIVITNDLKE